MFTNLNLGHNVSYHEELEITAHLDFIKEYRKDRGHDHFDLLTSRGSYLTYEYSLVELANYISKHLVEEHGIYTYQTGLPDSIILQNISGSNPFIMSLTVGNAWSLYDKLKFNFAMMVTSFDHIVTDIRQLFQTQFRRADAQVKWWYFSGRSATHITVALQDPVHIKDEFYPWFPEGPTKYFENYLNSTASILFLCGAPGTGKTTFLRDMMHKYNMNTYICYDEKVLKDDGMFIEFITSDETELLVLEDAETSVLPRKSDNNQMITRFLNVSDGLIKFPRKKIIFTTNEANFGNVDEAILRPGRCHGIVEFKTLTWEQSVAAAKVANLPIPETPSEYTIAELFNGVHKKRRKMGFTA